MRTVFLAVAGMSILATLCGCAGEKGTQALYAYEKVVWQARMAERRIWFDAFARRGEDVLTAIHFYEAALADNPLDEPAARTWTPRIRREIEKLRLSAKVALAKLYFIRLQEDACVTYFKSSLERHDLLFRDRKDLGLSLIRELYAREGRDPYETLCSSAITEIVRDDELWDDGRQIGDTLIAMPGFLVRVDLDRGAALPDDIEQAEGFFGRVIATWPDSLVARKARLARADLHVLLERYDDALSDLDAVLHADPGAPDLDEITLFRGEILAHGLGRYADAETVLTRVLRDGRGGGLSRAATLDLAAIKMKTGKTREAVTMLRELETEKDTPPETQTAAMFLRALSINDAGEWEEAVTLLWRICRLHPFTRAGMISPLVMLRHELSIGDREGATNLHAKAVEFYSSAIDRNVAPIEYRHLVKDYLIESFLIVGDPRGAAETLADRAPSWAGENGSVGFIKSAMIYLNLLNDRENGVRMLEKCLDLFPGSRYSEWVRQRLDSLSRRQTLQ
jgi:tetratricopeptide (TPR) repeat protein